VSDLVGASDEAEAERGAARGFISRRIADRSSANSDFEYCGSCWLARKLSIHGCLDVTYKKAPRARERQRSRSNWERMRARFELRR